MMIMPMDYTTGPYAINNAQAVARDLRDRMDRMMAAMIVSPESQGLTFDALAQQAMRAIQAVDDALYDEGVECE